MSNTLARSFSSSGVSRSSSRVASPAARSPAATRLLRGLSRPLPLPCAKITSPVASGGTPSRPLRRSGPRSISTESGRVIVMCASTPKALYGPRARSRLQPDDHCAMMITRIAAPPSPAIKIARRRGVRRMILPVAPFGRIGCCPVRDRACAMGLRRWAKPSFEDCLYPGNSPAAQWFRRRPARRLSPRRA